MSDAEPCPHCGGQHDDIIVGIQTDPTTYLPVLVLGVPSDDGMVLATLDPRVAAVLGASLIRTAGHVSQLRLDLSKRSMETRKEIMDLYDQFQLQTDEVYYEAGPVDDLS